MIRTDSEYRAAVERLTEEKQRLDAHALELSKQALTDDEVKRLMDPLTSFYLQFKEEVDAYERLKQGFVDELRNLRNLGQLLIHLRIARGLSQQALAEKLGVSPSQVSRDERNEYHGVTVDRAARILEALCVNIRLECEVEAERPAVA